MILTILGVPALLLVLFILWSIIKAIIRAIPKALVGMVKCIPAAILMPFFFASESKWEKWLIVAVGVAIYFVLHRLCKKYRR